MDTVILPPLCAACRVPPCPQSARPALSAVTARPWSKGGGARWEAILDPEWPPRMAAGIRGAQLPLFPEGAR